MVLWKPYRVLFRQGYHYFSKIDGARDFIKDFEKNKVMGVTLTIEKIDKEKFKSINPRYGYHEIYDDYEKWTMTISGWKPKRVGK